jgi:hypothetical protein
LNGPIQASRQPAPFQPEPDGRPVRRETTGPAGRLAVLIACCATAFMLGAAVPHGASADGDGQKTGPARQLQQRIDFGNTQILGQSIKSGAVYLMHRKKSDIKSMIKVREDYREEIMEDYGLHKRSQTDGNASDAGNDGNSDKK